MEGRTLTDIDYARRLEARRRMERGVVATYVHELSNRHPIGTDGAGRAPSGIASAEHRSTAIDGCR